ncbi:hypothetical protein PUP49_03160 [Pseudomonas chlororaphis]|nr:hypothetical protein [Pseudomonas chlororaphis]WDG92431.1 hypothetical protein PUP49_03160 [Pseudomonas chlororaphis]
MLPTRSLEEKSPIWFPIQMAIYCDAAPSISSRINHFAAAKDISSDRLQRPSSLLMASRHKSSAKAAVMAN